MLIFVKVTEVTIVTSVTLEVILFTNKIIVKE